MRWTPRRMALTASIAMAVVTADLAVAVPAAHASTWTVTNGGSLDFTNTPIDSLDHLIAHNITQSNWIMDLTCPDSEATGSIANGSGQSGTAIAEIDFLRVGGYDGDPNFCQGTGGGHHIWLHMPLFLNAESHSSGVTTGRLTGADGGGVAASIITDGGCEATINGVGSTEGTIGITYENNTHSLQFAQAGTNLEVSWTNNSCAPHEPQVGDDYTLEGKLVISHAMTITSP